MQMKYSDIAQKNGLYVVGACGWDSIPCDLGVNFLKEKFNGQLNHVETFVQLNTGPAVWRRTFFMLLLLFAFEWWEINDRIIRIWLFVLPFQKIYTVVLLSILTL